MIVGLTGGIGSGKTTVAKIFNDFGISIYNSDLRAKALMQNNAQLKEQIIEHFGLEAYDNGQLNRGYIAEIIFNDKSELQKMNALVHPVVRNDVREWARQQVTPYVLQESAILFESGASEFYDKTILITAPIELRIKRVMQRDQVDRTSVLNRMDDQWSDAEKVPLADYVIQNKILEDTRRKIGYVHEELLKWYPNDAILLSLG